MIFLITGIMASGKSTVGELLAQNFPKSVHLRGDVFRKMMVKGRVEMSENPTPEALHQLDLRYRLAAHAAKEYHQAGFTVILQDNFYGDSLPYMLDLLAPEPVQVVVLCPDVETVKQRERARGKAGYHSFRVEKLHEEFMRTTPRLGLWIDNSGQTPQETVERILEQTGE